MTISAMQLKHLGICLFYLSISLCLGHEAMATDASKPPPAGPSTSSCFCPAKECRVAGVQCHPPILDIADGNALPRTFRQPTMCLFRLGQLGEKYCVAEFETEVEMCPYLNNDKPEGCPETHLFEPLVCGFDEKGDCRPIKAAAITVLCSGGTEMTGQDGFAPSTPGRVACAQCRDNETECKAKDCEGYIIESNNLCKRAATPTEKPCVMGGKHSTPDSRATPLPAPVTSEAIPPSSGELPTQPSQKPPQQTDTCPAVSQAYTKKQTKQCSSTYTQSEFTCCEPKQTCGMSKDTAGNPVPVCVSGTQPYRP
jgi:hypothetical protein